MTPETTPSPVDSIDLHRASLEEVLATLRVTARTGLSDAEAEARLRRYGPNEIPEEQRHPVREFLKKFWGLSAWMLELIMVMSWAVQKYADVVVVDALLLVNAIVSLVQERRASGVIDALRRRLQVTARVQRNGAWQVVPARDLVPGDIVRVRQGGTDGFAEVYPEDKYTVVQRLQAAGHAVGMTGDGVNDAPALRQAEVGIAVSSATDVAKGAASVVLTDEGLVGIVNLVQQGRVIYQRILIWVVNKISRTILKSAFVTVAFLATGRFVISAFGMLLLVFLTDFAKIALATDQVRWSRRPETWRSTGYVQVAVALGVVMVIEALALLAIGWRAFGLATHDEALHTFTFQTLFYFALFSILSIRERRRFWASRPSGVLTLALLLDALVGTAVSMTGLPGLSPLPWAQTALAFSYAMVCCLVVNDPVKVALMKRVGWEG